MISVIVKYNFESVATLLWKSTYIDNFYIMKLPHGWFLGRLETSYNEVRPFLCYWILNITKFKRAAELNSLFRGKYRYETVITKEVLTLCTNILYFCIKTFLMLKKNQEACCLRNNSWKGRKNEKNVHGSFFLGEIYKPSLDLKGFTVYKNHISSAVGEILR